jgi:hypothetical protein
MRLEQIHLKSFWIRNVTFGPNIGFMTKMENKHWISISIKYLKNNTGLSTDFTRQYFHFIQASSNCNSGHANLPACKEQEIAPGLNLKPSQNLYDRALKRKWFNLSYERHNTSELSELVNTVSVVYGV